MILVTESPGFKRSYKRLIQGRSDLEQTLRGKLRDFIENPYNPQLVTHKLKRNLKGSWAFSHHWKLRVVFSFADNETVLLEDIGPHDKVY